MSKVSLSLIASDIGTGKPVLVPQVLIRHSLGWVVERLVFHCRTTSASTAPCTSRWMCCPVHRASYCGPYQPLLRAFSGWIRYPPPTEGPAWGYPMLVLGAVCSFLEPFCGNLSPKIDKVSEELTLKYPHEEPCVVGLHTWRQAVSASERSQDKLKGIKDFYEKVKARIWT